MSRPVLNPILWSPTFIFRFKYSHCLIELNDIIESVNIYLASLTRKHKKIRVNFSHAF